MTTTGFNLPSASGTSVLTHGAAVGAPSIAADQADNDTHVVTDDGTENGEVLELWKFDLESSTWIEIPLGSPCPDPMTRAQLRALRTASGLVKDCHYVVTDYNRGTVGLASILLHAVDANTLSMSAEVKTTFDTLAWSGRYDIDTNRLVELSDDRGNKVTGQEIVDTFPWGNTSLSDNIIMEGSVFTYVDGTFTDNLIKTGATVIANNTGAGQFVRNTIGEESRVEWTAGDMRENVIAGDATVTKSSTGDFDNNEVGTLANVNVSGAANVDRNYFGASTTVTISGGSVYDNDIGTDSILQTVGASVYDNTVHNGSRLTQTTARNIYGNNITRTSVVVVGDHNFFQNEVAFSSVNSTGSTGAGIRYVKFLDSRAVTGLRNITTLDFAYSTVSNNSSIAANGATRFYARYMTLENYGRLLIRAGALFDSNYTSVRDYSYIQVLGGRLHVNYSSLAGVSYINQAATVTGTNRVDRATINSNSRVRFLNTVSNCRVYYCEVSTGSYIEHRGTSSGCYVYYTEVTSSSVLYSNNSVNWRCYYNALSGNSELSSQNNTGTHYAYYNVCEAHGYLRMNNGRGYFYALHVSSQSVVTLNGGTTSSRLYYSSFASYYYLTLSATSLPATRTAVHGYGRRSYTPTAAISNGTFTQNFT